MVCAVFIVLLAVTYVMGMFLGGSHTHARAQDVSRMNTLAQSRMDILMGTDFKRLASASGTFSGADEKFSWKATVEPYKTDMKKITLTVTSPIGRTESLVGLRCPNLEDEGMRLYREYGCASCHAITKFDWARGVGGPTHDGIARTASTRISGMSAGEYLEQSVRDPSAYLVPGFEPGMAAISETDMSNAQLKAITKFMMTLR